MTKFNIHKPDQKIRQAIIDKIDNLNKPKGSLGRLEELALQVCLIEQTLHPTLHNPCHLLFVPTTASNARESVYLPAR